MDSAPRPIVTVMCLASLGIASFGALMVDQGQESSGRSGIAREARDFAVALELGSSDVLRFLRASDRQDPQEIAELRHVMSRVSRGAELLVSKVELDPGGGKGTSRIEVVVPTPRGPASGTPLMVEWVRTPDGEWKAHVLAP